MIPRTPKEKIGRMFASMCVHGIQYPALKKGECKRDGEYTWCASCQISKSSSIIEEREGGEYVT